MDSMRNMSTSLPFTSSRQRGEQATDLLSDFKAAALSVTNLYKTATTAQNRALGVGYQNALDDLLQFLDRENLGLMDGEGWKVRQWATKRLDGDRLVSQAVPNRTSSTSTDDEEEHSNKDDKENERSCSPEDNRTSEPPANPSSDNADEHSSNTSDNSHESLRATTAQQEHVVPQSTFDFRSNLALPERVEKETNGMEVDTHSQPPRTTETSEVQTSMEPIRIPPRSIRAKNLASHNRRTEKNSIGFSLNLGSNSGGKRKLPYPDFFDISGINDAATDRGGKRGRHT